MNFFLKAIEFTASTTEKAKQVCTEPSPSSPPGPSSRQHTATHTLVSHYPKEATEQQLK